MTRDRSAGPRSGGCQRRRRSISWQRGKSLRNLRRSKRWGGDRDVLCKARNGSDR